RQRIARLPGGGNLPHVGGYGPGVEVDLRFGTKGFLPGRGSASLMTHGLEYIRRDGAVEEFLRGRGVVADRSPSAGLVLHLHNDYGALRVERLEVAHERGERADIQLLGRGTKRRWRIRGLAVLVDQVEITRRVRLHPLGHVVLAAVLPGAEPEQVQPDVVLACLGDDAIDHRE